MKPLFVGIFGLAVALSLSSCVGMVNHPAKLAVDKDSAAIARYQRQQAAQQESVPAVTRSSAVFVGNGTQLPLSQTETLPALFQRRVTLVESSLTLFDVANRLTKLSGISVKVAPELKPAATATASTEAGSVPSVGSFATTTTTSGSSSPPGSIDAAFSGSLVDLLNLVAAHFNVSWEYTDGLISLYKYKTQVFTVTAPVGLVKFTTGVSNTSGATVGETSTAAQQTVNATGELSPWKFIFDDVTKMLSSAGAVSENQSAGTLTVTDTPEVLKTVSKYLTVVNRRFAKQISATVSIYAFRSNRGSDISADLNLAFQRLQNDLSITVDSASPVTSLLGHGNLAAAILPGSSNKTMSKFANSEALIQALRDIGDVSLMTTASGITLNNQPLPLQNLRRLTYVAKETVTPATDGAAPVKARETAESTTGFAMTLIPNVLDNNKIVLQVNLDLSSLDALTRETFDDGFLELPDVSTRSFMQRIAVQPGSTLVLSGFQQIRSTDRERNGLFGFSKSRSQNTENVIITLTVDTIDGASF